MSKVKLTLFLVALLGIMACKKEVVTHKYYDDIIQNIVVQLNDTIPTQYGGIMFFGKSNDNEILVLYDRSMRFIYNRQQNKISFVEFFTKVLNQEIKVEKHKYFYSFLIDEEIKRAYESNTFNDFILLYSDKTDDGGSYRIRNIKSDESEYKIHTVIYYLFLNGYLTTFDDYSGFNFAEYYEKYNGTY